MEEADLSPNIMTKAFSDEFLLEKVIELIRELGAFPVHGNFLMKARADSSFPSEKTFRRFGGKQELVRKLVQYCTNKADLQDIIDICSPLLGKPEQHISDTRADAKAVTGYVYLMKSGKHYKIGKSNAPGRREYDIGLKLPEPLRIIHEIATDDPAGIEKYWHERFRDKRKGGEWFDLTKNDISAFRAWKRII
jgi:hypothetical protein